MSRKTIKVSFTLAKVVCGFHSRLDQCRDRNFSFYLQHCYRLPHAAASNAASVNGPLKCNFNFNFPYFKFKVPAKFYLLLFYLCSWWYCCCCWYCCFYCQCCWQCCCCCCCCVRRLFVRCPFDAGTEIIPDSSSGVNRFESLQCFGLAD